MNFKQIKEAQIKEANKLIDEIKHLDSLVLQWMFKILKEG